MSYAFRIRCTASCPISQRALIALAERGVEAEVEVVPAQPVSRTGQALPIALNVPLLTVTDEAGRKIEVAGTLAMIELIEDVFALHSCYPNEPFARAKARDLMELGCGIQQQLSLVTRATDFGELDILIHRLRDRLSAAEARFAGKPLEPFGNADIVFAPTLWRLRLLNRTSQAFLLTGFPVLSAWAERLSVRPSVTRILDDAAEEAYLAGLRQRDAAILDSQSNAVWSEIVHLPARARGAG